MSRYYVIEMWENTEPHFIFNEVDFSNNGGDTIFNTDDLEEAKKELMNCQEGYILDFEEMKIIKL